MSIRIKNTEEVAIDLNYYWLPMESCPRGVKVQLLNPGGVAIHGRYTGKERIPYLGWTPLPKRRPEDETERAEILGSPPTQCIE